MSLNTQFIDMIWLKFYGLSRVNVLDYFYTSPFFDLSSNNQLIRTQGVRPEHLVGMVGLEYALDEYNMYEPNLYVIKMQQRRSPREVSLLEVYYCIDGIIYQSPDMLDLVISRVAKAAHYLGNSFDHLHGTTNYSSKNGHICWAPASIVADAAIDPNVEKSSNVNSTKVPEIKTPNATAVIREFPPFSRLIDDLNSSF
jgi:mediator of RNA polymerase II transcription subunit 6